MRTTYLHFELDRDETQGHAVSPQEIRGIVRIESDALVMEFGIQEGAADAEDAGYRGTSHTVLIPIADVVRVELTGGAVKSPRLLLEVAREEALMRVPWADGCICVVRFRRADAVHAQELLTEIEVRIAEVQRQKEKSRDS